MRSPRFTITFTEEMYNQIKSIAYKKNCSMGEVVRGWAIQGLNGKVSKDNISLVSEIIEETLTAYLNPKIERLAAISAKGAIMSAATTYLNAETLSKFVPKESLKEYQEVYEQARKKAVAYVRRSIDDE